MIFNVVCIFLGTIITTINVLLFFGYTARYFSWDYWFCKDKKQDEIDTKKDEKLDEIINEIKAIKSEQKATNERIDDLEFTVEVIDDIIKL